MRVVKPAYRVLMVLALVAAFLAAAGAFPHHALAANPDAGLMPSSPLDAPLHEQASIWNYLLDGRYSKLNVVAWMFHGLAQLFWVLYLLLMKLVVWVVEQCFTLSIHDHLMNVLHAYLSGFIPAFWSDGLRRLVWYFGAIWFGWTAFVQRNWARAMSGLAVILLVSAFALGGAETVVWVGNSANYVSRSLSGLVLIAGAYDMPPHGDLTGDDALEAAGAYYSDKLWINLVNKPWCSLEFGSLDTCHHFDEGINSLIGDKVLMSNEAERDNWYNSQTDKEKETYLTWWTETSKALARAIMALLLLVTVAVFGLWIGYCAIRILSTGFSALAWGVGFPVLLLAACVPSWTATVLRTWFTGMLQAYVGMFAYAVVMTLGLTGASVTWAYFESYGWLAQTIMLFVWTLLIIGHAGRIVAFLTQLPFGVDAALSAAQNSRPEFMEGAAKKALSLAGAGLATRTMGRVTAGAVRRYKGWRDRSTASRTLTQRLSQDLAQYRSTGKKGDLVLQYEQRRDMGARRIWDDTDLAAEIERNRQLRRIGVHPGALAVGGERLADVHANLANLHDEINIHRQALKAEHRRAMRNKGGFSQNTRIARVGQWIYQATTAGGRAKERLVAIKTAETGALEASKQLGRTRRPRPSGRRQATAKTPPVLMNQPPSPQSGNTPQVGDEPPQTVVLLDQHGHPLATFTRPPLLLTQSQAPALVGGHAAQTKLMQTKSKTKTAQAKTVHRGPDKHEAAPLITAPKQSARQETRKPRGVARMQQRGYRLPRQASPIRRRGPK